MRLLEGRQVRFLKENGILITTTSLLMMAILIGLVPRLLFGCYLGELREGEGGDLAFVVFMAGLPALCFLGLIWFGICLILSRFIKNLHEETIWLIGGGLLIFISIALAAFFFSNGGGWIWVGVSIIVLCVFMFAFINAPSSGNPLEML